MKSAARTFTNSLHCKAFAEEKLKQVRTMLLKSALEVDADTKLEGSRNAGSE